MLDHLVELGLVERARAEHDRRVVLSRLTEQGRSAVAERREHHLRRWREALDDLDLDELRAAAVVLDRLHELFDGYSVTE
jgi:DNA-binding MarR family transcriptional regulator